MFKFIFSSMSAYNFATARYQFRMTITKCSYFCATQKQGHDLRAMVILFKFIPITSLGRKP